MFFHKKKKGEFIVDLDQMIEDLKGSEKEGGFFNLWLVDYHENMKFVADIWMDCKRSEQNAIRLKNGLAECVSPGESSCDESLDEAVNQKSESLVKKDLSLDPLSLTIRLLNLGEVFDGVVLEEESGGIPVQREGNEASGTETSGIEASDGIKKAEMYKEEPSGFEGGSGDYTAGDNTTHGDNTAHGDPKSPGQSPQQDSDNMTEEKKDVDFFRQYLISRKMSPCLQRMLQTPQEGMPRGTNSHGDVALDPKKSSEMVPDSSIFGDQSGNGLFSVKATGKKGKGSSRSQKTRGARKAKRGSYKDIYELNKRRMASEAAAKETCLKSLYCLSEESIEKSFLVQQF